MFLPPSGLGCCPFKGGGSVVVDFLFIVTPIVGVCNCYMFCCALLYVHSSIAIILMGKRELAALLGLSSWCLVVVGRLFAGPRSAVGNMSGYRCVSDCRSRDHEFDSGLVPYFRGD